MEGESLSSQEMLEKIAQLDYSANRLKGLNEDMTSWLDGAEDEIASLRSENDSLRKRVAYLENLTSEVPEDEAEPCMALWVDDFNEIRGNEEKICELENKSKMLKEQNEMLTEQLKSLQQELDQNQESFTNLGAVPLTFQFDLEEAQLGLQHRDEIIDQKIQQLKYLEENVEECLNVIKDLRTTNQELKKQLEDRLNESYFAMLNGRTRESEGSSRPSLSFAEEIQLLASPAEVKTSITDSADLQHEETESEKQLMPHIPISDLHTERLPCRRRGADSSETAVMSTKLLLLLCVLVVFTCIVSESVSLFNTLWSRWYLIVQPYWNIQYGGLPPI